MILPPSFCRSRAGIKASVLEDSSHCNLYLPGYWRRSSRIVEAKNFNGSSWLFHYISAMTVVALPASCDSHATICSGANCLVPPSDFNEVLSLVLSTVLTIMLAMVMFSMGCTVDVVKLWGHIRRPWGIFIGFLCQFGIMPFTAFALALAFQVLPVQAIVIIIMGCCPGGTGSNIICYWLDGDMDLR